MIHSGESNHILKHGTSSMFIVHVYVNYFFKSIFEEYKTFYQNVAALPGHSIFFFFFYI